MNLTEPNEGANKFNKKISTISHIAELVATFGLILLFGTLVYGIYLLMLNGSTLDAEITKNYLGSDNTITFTLGQRMFGVIFMSLSSIVGIIGLYQARQLFAGYQKGEIFTARAAARFQVIGWILIILVPVSKIKETLGAAYFNSILEPDSLKLSLSFLDVDIYAIVFGLLMVVVGYVMRTAVTISDENKGFI